MASPFPISSKHLGPPRTEKADVAEHLKAFNHVGILFNQLPGRAEMSFN